MRCIGPYSTDIKLNTPRYVSPRDELPFDGIIFLKPNTVYMNQYNPTKIHQFYKKGRAFGSIVSPPPPCFFMTPSYKLYVVI